MSMRFFLLVSLMLHSGMALAIWPHQANMASGQTVEPIIISIAALSQGANFTHTPAPMLENTAQTTTNAASESAELITPDPEAMLVPGAEPTPKAIPAAEKLASTPPEQAKAEIPAFFEKKQEQKKAARPKAPMNAAIKTNIPNVKSNAENPAPQSNVQEAPPAKPGAPQTFGSNAGSLPVNETAEGMASPGATTNQIAREQEFGQAAGPNYKRFVSPPYPEKAKLRRQEGFVLLRVFITAQGRAARWEVLEASNPVFVAAAEQSLRLSSFHPYTEDGQARDCWVRLPLRFTLR